MLSYLSDRVAGWHVARAVGVEPETKLAYSALHQVRGPMLNQLDRCPHRCATPSQRYSVRASDLHPIGSWWTRHAVTVRRGCRATAVDLRRGRRPVARQRLSPDPGLRRPAARRRPRRYRLCCRGSRRPPARLGGVVDVSSKSALPAWLRSSLETAGAGLPRERSIAGSTRDFDGRDQVTRPTILDSGAHRRSQPMRSDIM